jgi:anti-anti-sigma factor
MSTKKSNQKEVAVLRIEGEFTIFRAAKFKDILLAEPAPTEIDLSGVTEIDTAGVQLLMLAKQTAQQEQRDLHLVAHSPAVLEVFELLNVAAYFNDPLVMARAAQA